MGRWDFLADARPQELKDYVLDCVADELAGQLQRFPPTVDLWLDDRAEEKWREVMERRTAPDRATYRVALGMAWLDLQHEVEVIDRFWKSPVAAELVPTDLERKTAHFLTQWIIDQALEFQDVMGQGKFRRADLVRLVEKLEDRLVGGDRLRLDAPGSPSRGA